MSLGVVLGLSGILYPGTRRIFERLLGFQGSKFTT